MIDEAEELSEGRSNGTCCPLGSFDFFLKQHEYLKNILAKNAFVLQNELQDNDCVFSKHF